MGIDKLIDIFLCGSVVILEIVGILILMLLVQGLVYNLSNRKINLYKTIWQNLQKLDKKMNNYFNNF